MLAEQLRQPVEIEALETGWDGWNPKLILKGFRVLDRARSATTPQLELPAVEMIVAWTSLPTARLRLKELVIERPRLAIRRDRAGVLHVGGLAIDPDQADGDSPFSDWLLAPRRSVVRDAGVSWNDDQRNAPQLVLDRVQLRLENSLGEHRLGLRGTPPPALAAPIDVRAEWRGRSLRDWRDAQGRFYIRLDFADVMAWREWLPLPVPVNSGKGALRLWFEFADGFAHELVGDIELFAVRTRLDPALPELKLDHLAGRVGWRDNAGRREVFARNLAFTTPDGSALEPTTFKLTLRDAVGATPATALIEFDRMQLAPLRQVAAQLPLPAPMRVDLARYAPRGTLLRGRLLWEGPRDAPIAYAGRADFSELGVSAQGVLPGGAGLTGSVEFTQSSGELKLQSRHAALDLPRVFLAPLAFDRLDGKASWEKKGGRVAVRLEAVEFANAHAAGRASGVYRSADNGPGSIDLDARLTGAELVEVQRYLPRNIERSTREWLRLGLTAGRSPEATLKLVGDLADFPFADGQRGQFKVVVKATGATLDYADHWPPISDIDAIVRFEGRSLVVESGKGRVYAAQITGVRAEIRDLSAYYPALHIEGSASGPTADFVRFVDQSPVAQWVGGITSGAQAAGNGQLTLGIDLALGKASDSRVAGEFAFVDTQLRLPGVPMLAKVNGTLAFTEATLAAHDIAFDTLGGSAQIAIASTGEQLRVTGAGTANVAALRKEMPFPFADRVSGTLPWNITVDLGAPAARWAIESSGKGVVIDLPAPVGKRADEALPLRLAREPVAGQPGADLLTLTGGNEWQVLLRRRLRSAGTAIDRVHVDLGAQARAAGQPRLDRDGVWLKVDLPSFNLDDWLAVLKADGPGSIQEPGESPALGGFDLGVGTLEAFGGHWNDIRISGRPAQADLRFVLDGRDVTGTAPWSPPSAGGPNGRLVARLSRVATGSASEKGASAAAAPRGDAAKANAWPELDIKSDAYVSKGRDLGRLELTASPGGAEWRIHRLRLTNDDGALDASGVWRSTGRQQETTLDVALDVGDAAAYLGRLGHPDAVKGAPTRILGQLSWNGAPNELDYPSLTGSFRVDVGAGRFTKVEPGIGKLLGVLSLQALPRRITLDFRDVFSDGFAFDRISGTVRVERGQLSTSDLKLVGPAAKVEITGDADIAQETQRLRVRVQPTLSAGVSAGAALLFIANPLVGAAVGAGSLLAQKLLQDPVEQMFSYAYRITGSWSDPVVARGTEATAASTTDRGRP
jgi:uncharacterized protein (TIGR02099 family)